MKKARASSLNGFKDLFLPATLAFCLGFVVLPAKGQVITEIGTGVISTLPGSPTDYIFFNGSTFMSGVSVNDSPDSDLTSFNISGGIGTTSVSPSSSITPPGGASSLATGALDAATSEDGGAFYSLAVSIKSTDNPSFNYSDFDVYVMYSNTLGKFDDSGILLEDISAYSDDPYNGFPANAVPVVDNNTNPDQAYYVEYNVQDFVSGDVLALGAETTNANHIAYIGAISFEEVPEPATYALFGGGLALLGLGLRFSRMRPSVRGIC